jgi:hypothetical protein
MPAKAGIQVVTGSSIWVAQNNIDAIGYWIIRFRG